MTECIYIKNMEKNTIRELRDIAKQKKMVGYYKLAINQKLESLKSNVKSLFVKVRTKKFKIRKTASAIKGFTKQYTIDGTSGIDSLSFLNAVRPHVVNL